MLERAQPSPAGGTFLERFSDLGGDPWAPANQHNTPTLDLPKNPDGADDGDGYTNLEEWLHLMAAAVETADNLPPVANAGADAITGPLCAPNIFRSSFSNWQPGYAMGMVAAQRGHKKAMTIIG